MSNDHATDIGSTMPITEQASAWWVLLNSGDATPADHRIFCEWFARAPERVEAFLQTVRLSQALQSGDIHWPDTSVEDLIRAAKAAPGEVINLPLTRESGNPSARNDRERPTSSASTPRAFSFSVQTAPRIAAAAAAVFAALTGGWYFFLTPEQFRTALGDQRSVVLNDDSVVTLNTSSSIKVRMAKNSRTVQLLSGEAMFQVAHDAMRPFYVTTGNTTIRAVGTQFNVDRRADDIIITVAEGKVAVVTGTDDAKSGKAAAFTLAAGEQVTVAPRSRPHVERANVATATAWMQRKLVFEHRPLGEVADEFNRYNHQTIEIQSAQLRSQEITGVFHANDPDSFMTFLGKIPNVNIERSADSRHYVVTQDNQQPSAN